MILNRYQDNPILQPNPVNDWEKKAAFNPCVVADRQTYHMLYRSMGEPVLYRGVTMPISTIGYARSSDGFHFAERRQFIIPQEPWEIFGCEDARVTKIDDMYYIFYTALSGVPFNASTIKVGLAKSKDLKTISEKHLVTPFNAKAMTIFPKKIKGKWVVMLTAHTDMPPAKVAIAHLDRIEDLWSADFWNSWHHNLVQWIIPLRRSKDDHIEVGSPPVETDSGWLIFYSYIKNYFSGKPVFRIECALLDRENPQKIIGRILHPLLLPETEYELQGMVPNVVFPTGAVIAGENINVYYGAADTSCSVATARIKDILSQIKLYNTHNIHLIRSENNPILKPEPARSWESKAVFNPAAFYENNSFHIIYRAMGDDNTSVFGYATSTDGITIRERLDQPIYTPRAEFESKKKSGYSGCEDPRITRIEDRYYMCYTAFDGYNPPRVALSSISVSDVMERRWRWRNPVLISPPGIDDKDACIFPEKIKGKYIIFHRINPNIVIDFVDSLDFDGLTWVRVQDYITPRNEYWDNDKIGICAPPVKTDHGWLLLYHGVSNIDNHYRIGAMLLKVDDPTIVISRSDTPILKPELPYEREGQVPQVVFPCGNVLFNDTLYVYYGGGDSVVGVATIKLQTLLQSLLP